jgi:DNA-binding helix-turn-helix protein
LSTIDIVLRLSKERGISQAFICNKLGLSRNYLSEVKKGKTSLSDDRLIIIADILNTTPEYLKGETDIKEKPTDLVVSGKDKELLDLIEKLTEEQRQMLILQVKGLLSDQ